MFPDPSALDPATIVAHDDALPAGAVVPPIFQTSLFTFGSYQELEDAMAGRVRRPIYSRGDNPTVQAFEAKVAALEGAEAARAFASGMAAISAAVLSNLRAGERMLCVRHCYPDAFRLFATLLPRFGIQVDFVDGRDAAAVERALPGAKLLYLESPTSVDSAGAIAGLQFLIDLYQNGHAPKDSVNWGFNEIVAGFYSGTCAMLDQDPDALIANAERMPAEDFAVAPMPLGPAGKSFPTIGYAGWSMFQASEREDEAWALIAHLPSRASDLAWSKFVGVIPIHEGAEQNPVFATEQYAGWFTELNDGRWQPTSMPTYLEEFGYFADVLVVQSGQEALLGERTAEDVAGEWAAYLSAAQKKWLEAQ